MISKNVQVQLLMNVVKQDMQTTTEWTERDKEFYKEMLRKCLALLEDKNQGENNK